MDKILHQEALRVMKEIKEAPEWMQNMNLVLLCKNDPTGLMEPMARKLAEYDIPSEKIVPCLMDLMTIITMKFMKDEAIALPEHGIE